MWTKPQNPSQNKEIMYEARGIVDAKRVTVETKSIVNQNEYKGSPQALQIEVAKPTLCK